MTTQERAAVSRQAPAALRTIPDPVAEPTISVERAAKVLGVGKDAVYAALERGDWPCIRVGRRVVIPTRRWLNAVHLDSA
jgi:excisionase family DNA binding protein